MNEGPRIATISVLYQGPSGIVAKVNGKATLFQDREDLFRAAALLAESCTGAETVPLDCLHKDDYPNVLLHRPDDHIVRPQVRTDSWIVVFGSAGRPRTG